MSSDVRALVEVLQADPAQRAVLREALGVGSADVRGALEELAQAQARTDARLDELSKTVSELSRQVGELARAVRDLLDVAAGTQDRLAKLDGSDLERRYRERGPSYLQRVARRLRLIDSADLAELAHDAEDAELLSEREAESLTASDAVFRGQRWDDGERVHLVVEVSVTVARQDLRRARERADLLARIVEGPVLAVVAGEHVPGVVALAAQDAEVWCVARGRVLAPDGDTDDWV